MANIFSKLKNDKLFWITIIIFIFAFFIFRPYHMQERGLLYVGDDEGYFAQATSLAFFQFPDYSKEYYTDAGTGQPPNDKTYPMHSIGPGIMAFPFVFSFSLIDRLERSSIVKHRDLNNILGSWSLFGFILSTIFYFYTGIVFLYKALKTYFDDKICFYSILFMVLFQFFPLYVFRRPILSHIYEFFLQSVLIFFLVIDSKTKFLSNIKLWFSVLVGAIIGLVTLVRYNNLFFALLWPIVLFCFENNKFNFKNNWKKLLITYFIGIVLVFTFKFIPLLTYKYEAYYSAGLASFNIKNILSYIKVFFYIIFGVDFGLVFTAPFLLIGIVCLFILKFDFKKRIIIAFMPIIINIFLVLSAVGQYGWYGNRLIFFSIIPFLIFPFALFLKNLEEKAILKKWLIIFFILSIPPLISMMVFEGNSTNLTLQGGKQYSGQVDWCLDDWRNKLYQLEIWKTLFLHPAEFFKAIFKGGPLYPIYLFSKLFNFLDKLPGIIIEKYPVFRIDILIKTLIIYLFPFILFFILRLQYFKNFIKKVFLKKNI